MKLESINWVLKPAVKQFGTDSMFWQQNQGESLAEYSLTLALMLLVVVLTMKVIGSFAADIFSTVASSLE
ncbi:MAG TPA: hypothetical protein VEI52_02215 [Terriglobales bacterium]|nr:hypothetical protein [Terriglobales bacterium]